MRHLWIFVLLLLVASSHARQAASPSATEQAMSWLRTQWSRVEEQGRPMAERALREFPARFKDMKAQVAHVRKLANNFSTDHKLSEKKALLDELWRVRGSLNLMSLCSPDMVEQLTGLDAKTVQNLQNQLASIRSKLSTGKLSSP